MKFRKSSFWGCIVESELKKNETGGKENLGGIRETEGKSFCLENISSENSLV